jgi:hypothetical protein
MTRANRIAKKLRAKVRKAKVKSWKRHSDRDDLRQQILAKVMDAEIAAEVQ